jgi:hypothetical protein
MKWSGVPFTHICEWKRQSPSSGSSSSYGWIFVVEMVTLGSTSMQNFPLTNSKSEFELASNYGISSHPAMIVWREINECFSKGFFGTRTMFLTIIFPTIDNMEKGFKEKVIFSLLEKFWIEKKPSRILNHFSKVLASI